MDTKPATDTSSHRGAFDKPQEQLVLVIDRARLLDGGARHTLANVEQVTIGRGRVRSAERVVLDGRATLRLLVPDPRVSTLHVRLEQNANGWLLCDCESTNGTRVNQQRAATCALADGDVVEVGHTIFRYRAAEPVPIGAAGDVDGADLERMQRAFATLVPRLARDVRTLAQVARSDLAVLLLGESGTGKEVLARGIHEESGRAGPFVAVNCGAIPANLVESLLFGHRRGAFSGALRDEPGLFRAAAGGTLFLDEIGDLAPSAQAALLRVLQEREVLPLGETRPTPIDLRIVAATHRPLQALSQSGGFREDLLARVAGFVHCLPPLRDRIDDLGMLVAPLLRRIAPEAAASMSLDTDAFYALMNHPWPLNVRELEQRLKTAVALASDGRMRASHLWSERPPPGVPVRREPPALSPEERSLHDRLVEHLTEMRGNVTHVGEAMGKSRTQIQRWLRRFRIDAEHYRR
jgi:transcriptional regulator of acetoin/glycerol metabolism